MKRKMVMSACMLSCIGMLAGCGKEEAKEPVTGAMAVMDDVESGDTPNEPVFASSSGASNLSQAKLQKEEQRRQKKEEMMEVINDAEVSEERKQQAVNEMIAVTDITEKETAAEILLESKGFSDVVVVIQEDSVNVTITASELSETQRAQIEDIITRKTRVAPEKILITCMEE